MDVNFPAGSSLMNSKMTRSHFSRGAETSSYQGLVSSEKNIKNDEGITHIVLLQSILHPQQSYLCIAVLDI